MVIVREQIHEAEIEPEINRDTKSFTKCQEIL